MSCAHLLLLQKSLSAQNVPYSSPFCWFPHLTCIDIDPTYLGWYSSCNKLYALSDSCFSVTKSFRSWVAVS
ncbi:hypothetical protein BJV77DRAFT_978289 [Russula vinacea]|nr:hypothetical protein BJV77DRAFT_978289 [Russula vinacea]